MQEIKHWDVKVDDKEVEDEIDDIARENKITKQKLLASLEAAGVNPKTLREQLKAQIGWRDLVGGRYGSRARVDDQEVTQTIQRIADFEVQAPIPRGRDLHRRGDRGRDGRGDERRPPAGRPDLQGRALPGRGAPVLQRPDRGVRRRRGLADLGRDGPQRRVRPAADASRPALAADPVRQGRVDRLSAREARGRRLAHVPPRPGGDSAEARRHRGGRGGGQGQARHARAQPHLQELRGGGGQDPRRGRRGSRRGRRDRAVARVQDRRGLPSRSTRFPPRFAPKPGCTSCCSAASAPPAATSRAKQQVEDRLYSQQISMLAQRYLRDLHNSATIETR